MTDASKKTIYRGDAESTERVFTISFLRVLGASAVSLLKI
jgi:hypothetical protein